MAYTFSPISSPSGVEDQQIDCTSALKPLELLSAVTVTSQDTTALTISNEAVNTDVLTKDDGVTSIGVGKGIILRVTSVREQVTDVNIKVKYTGDDGTVRTVTIIQPIVKTITS